MLIFQIFEPMPDPRTPGHALRHRLIDILSIALCAMLSGAETFVDLEDYGRAKEPWLRERLGLELPHGIPSHDTFNRLFSLMEPHAFEACFMAWTQSLQEATQGDILALDGKSARRSFDAASGQGALHLVSVWASQARLVLAQQKVDQKSNEITAVPLLLEMLDLSGCVVTADALNSQKSIAAKVRERGGDYVLSLKENHRHLFEDVRDYFAWCQGQPGGLARWSDDSAQSKDWGHGRYEVRRCYCLATTPDEWPQALQQWVDLPSVVMMERERRGVPPAGVPTGGQVEPTTSRDYYLSSLAPQAPRLMHVVRAHWGIENSLHWVLDVAFGEDECRVRTDHAPHNLATLRKLSLNLLRQDSQAKCGVKARRKMAGWDDDYLLRILAGP
jgi:predicted transposase YbfD/YdcC